MKQGYLAAGFLAGMAVSLSLWNGLQAQEQNAATATPANDSEELPFAPPPPPPAKPVQATPIPGRNIPSRVGISASSSATTIIAPAATAAEPIAPAAKRRLPLWTTSTKQDGNPTAAATPPAAADKAAVEEPLFGRPADALPPTRRTPPPAPPRVSPAYQAIPAPAPPPAGEITPAAPPSSSFTSSGIVDVYVGVNQLEAGKPLLTGVLVGDKVEFGGKKFLKFVRPDNPQEYWLLDARIIIAAQFRR